ncbi:unnamed protein product [Closterium sp. NIES-54]
MAGPEEMGGRVAGGSGEAQAQGQPRDSAMAPMQPSLGPPRDEPRVFGLDKFNGDNFAEWSFKMENIFDHYDLLEVMEGTEKRPENDPEKSPELSESNGHEKYERRGGGAGGAGGAGEGEGGGRGDGRTGTRPEVGSPSNIVSAVYKGENTVITVSGSLAGAGAGNKKEEGLEAATSTEAAGVADTAMATRTTDAVADGSTASVIIATRAETCGAIATNSLMDGVLLKAKRVEEQEEGEEEAVEAVAVAEVVLQHDSNLNGGRGSSAYGNDNKNNGRGRGRFDDECHFRHKSGHMWRDCYKLPDGWTPAQGQEGRGAGGGRGRGRGGHGGRGGGTASMKSAGNESESRDDRFPGQFFFVSTQAPAGPEKDEGFEEPATVGKVTLHSLDYWVIDSGATYSMTPRADLLTELEPSPVKHVTSALGQRAEVKGMGKAMFKGADGKMVGLKNIPVVPMPKEWQVAASISTKGEAVGSGDGANGRAKEIDSKKCNLGGTSKLGEHKESGAAAQKQHKGEENSKEVAEEEYGESMWGTIASAAFSNPTSATGECDWLTLHRLMGHVALKGATDEVLGCPTCMQAKFTRYPFSSSEATAKAPLDEVVMDVVGPLKLGAAGEEYFLTIVDVYTRMTWVYVLSKKSGVDETVKTDWLPMVERQQDRLVKAIRTDRGREFLSKEFSLWLKKNGIRHSLTMPYSPAMNGIAERANRTITETARGLLIEAGLPDYFWSDAGLKKALYGLKQAPRQWYLKLRGVLEEIGFTPSTADHSLFMLGEGEQRSFMVVYVDDILIFSPSSDLVKEVIQDKFKCKALGDVSFYLGLHIERDVEKRCMRVHQRKYLEALATNFGQSEGHVATPFPSRFKCVKGPEEESVGEEERRRFHSLVAARMTVAKYLGQTPTVGLQYSAAAQRRQKGADSAEPGRLFLTAFSDASFASEPEYMTSVGGFICRVGGGPTAWESKKQVDQALSSVESEYMALFRAVREIVWQRRLLAELGEEQQGPTPLYCDSQGAIALAKNPVLHELTKHMRVKWHWTRSMVAAGEAELHYVKPTRQPADMMTKRLVEQQHWKCCKMAGMALN